MGFPLGLVSLGRRLRVAKQAVDSQGRTIWIVDAHRGDGKRFIVRADQKLTAFAELESAIGRIGGSLIAWLGLIMRPALSEVRLQLLRFRRAAKA